MKSGTLLVFLCLLASPYTYGQRTKKSDPCANAQTQAEMNNCAGREYKAADAVLNQVYRQLVSMLDDEEKSQLKEAQTVIYGVILVLFMHFLPGGLASLGPRLATLTTWRRS